MVMDPVTSSSSNAKPKVETTSPLLVDLISDHLDNCSDCHPPFKPVALGQRSGFCAAYWQMVQAWADDEGAANNIVAHDEFGNRAPRSTDPSNL